ncbi:MAG: hypothetical protein E7407_02070 [Ruminococcaceae bacterium]|nr:hypothetical protein [Oscillospiraceae bacterium]
MKTNHKITCAAILLFFILALAACSAPRGVKKTVTDETKSHTAYYYIRQGDKGDEYCLSLLKSGETLITEDEPNVYISDKEFDFEFSDGLLAVFMDEDAEPIEPVEIDGILIAYGHLS